MIEFNGYITGSAEKYFFKRARNLVRNLMLASLLLLFPIVIAFSVNKKFWFLLQMYCIIFVTLPLVLYIPKSKKEKKAITPKKIFTEDEYIICITDKCEEIRHIGDAKKVQDFGEFYEIIFPFGKVSEKYICQKSLLVKGTLEEFEALFEGKIVRKLY